MLRWRRGNGGAGGRIDVPVNTVGGTIWAQPYEHYTEAQAAEIRRSLFPTLWGCRTVLPTMLEQHQGVIVNISSIATRSVHRVPYSAAKGGVYALTAGLATEQLCMASASTLQHPVEPRHHRAASRAILKRHLY